MDYVEIPTSVTFAAGATETNVGVIPILDDRIEGDESVVITVLTNIAYSVSGDTATVTPGLPPEPNPACAQRICTTP